MNPCTFLPPAREAIILKYLYHFDEERFLDETKVNCQNCKGKKLCGQASSERTDSNIYLMLTRVCKKKLIKGSVQSTLVYYKT